jgi:D-alanyl-D-alanine carboxypeptidase
MADNLVRNAGMAPGSFALADASGLSAGNRFSAGQITSLLNRVRGNRAVAGAFMESLAEQGHHPHAMNPVPPEGLRVFVKTGTLSVQGVNTVAGYIVEQKSGRCWSFAILANRAKPGPMTYSGTLTNPLLKVLIDAVKACSAR